MSNARTILVFRSDLDGREEKRDFCATLSHSYRSSLLKDASLPQERVTSFQSLVALALASAVTRCMAEGLLTADETFQQLRDSLLSDNACLIGLLLILEMIPQEKARICFVPRERETLSAAIDQLKDYVLELITQVRSMLPSVADRYAICDCHYAVVTLQWVPSTQWSGAFGTHFTWRDHRPTRDNGVARSPFQLGLSIVAVVEHALRTWTRPNSRFL